MMIQVGGPNWRKVDDVIYGRSLKTTSKMKITQKVNIRPVCLLAKLPFTRLSHIVAAMVYVAT